MQDFFSFELHNIDEPFERGNLSIVVLPVTKKSYKTDLVRRLEILFKLKKIVYTLLFKL